MGQFKEFAMLKAASIIEEHIERLEEERMKEEAYIQSSLRKSQQEFIEELLKS